MAFGKEIKRLREDARYSAQKFADMIGVKAERLRKWEQNDQTPRDEDAAKFEDFFDLTLDEISKLTSIKQFQKVPREKRLKTQGSEIVSDLVLLKASAKVFGTTLAELMAAKNKSSVAKEAQVLEETIGKEADRLYGELGSAK